MRIRELPVQGPDLCVILRVLIVGIVGIVFVPALYALFQRLRERVKE